MAELSDYTAAPARAPRTEVNGRGAAARARSTALATWPCARIAIAFAELGIACASVLLALRLFAMQESQRDPFLAANMLPAPLRMQLLVQLFSAALLPMLAAGFVLARFKRDGASWLIRAGEICAPFGLACFLPTLLNYRQWYGQPLPYLVQLLAFVLVLERLLARAFGPAAGAWPSVVHKVDGAPSRFAKIVPLAIVIAAASGYAIYMSHYTIMRHHLLGTAGFDLGIFDNLMINAMHGPNFYDFHWMPVAMFFFYWLFFAIVKRRIGWIALLSVIVCSMREDTAFGTI
ncbi:MAG TPA: hypothetical protein VGI70_02665, partial [Polyangiales bacterium]